MIKINYASSKRTRIRWRDRQGSVVHVYKIRKWVVLTVGASVDDGWSDEGAAVLLASAEVDCAAPCVPEGEPSSLM